MLSPAVRPVVVHREPRAVDQGEVIVIVARTRGSTPREAGARMRIGPLRSDGSIGGGHLEHEAIRLARLLPAGGSGHLRFILGASLGQCCGGEVELAFVPASWLDALPADGLALPLPLAVAPDRQAWRVPQPPAGEPRPTALRPHVPSRHDPSRPDPTRHAAARAAAPSLESAGDLTGGVALVRGDPPWLLIGAAKPGPRVLLCGAGHVGIALARLLGPLDCRLDWVDGRDDLAPLDDPGLRRWRDIDPVAAADAAPAGTHLIVMTHDHALDYDIISAALRRDDLPFVGLIGSMTKRRRFDHRLKRDGLAPAQIGRLRCPLGQARTRDKSPAAIAILIAAQLLAVWDEARRDAEPVTGERVPAGSSEAN